MARVLIVTDHKWRDLPGNANLKVVLEKNFSHKVVLSRLNEEATIVPSFKPNLVVYNNLYDKKKNEYAKYLSSKGIKIAILPTEGITFSEEQTLLFSHKYADIEFVDLYLSWNELMFDAILKNEVLMPSALKKVGCIRFDFYSEKFSELIKGKDYFLNKYKIQPNTPNILFATNFANADFWPATHFLEKDLERQRAKKIPAFRDSYKIAKFEHYYRKKIFEILHCLSKKDSKANILIKYHPSEKTSVYKDLLKELNRKGKKIFLIEGEYIWDLINISNIIVQRCSTVAIESWLFSKPTIELKLMESPEHFLKPVFESGSWIVKNKNEFFETLESILENPLYIPEEMANSRRDILDKTIYKPDGFATERAAYELDLLLRENKNRKIKVGYFNSRNMVKSIVRKLFGMKGYDIISNLYRFKIGDYLGRYDKTYQAKDQKYWEIQIKKNYLKMHTNT